MSRKWSRKIDKNKKNVNEQRKKSGKEMLQMEKNEVKFVGRSWVLPSFLLAMLAWYLILFIGERGFMFWFTVVGYTLLILFLFFLKRPYIIVGKDFIQSRRFGGDFKVPASEIAKLVLTGDSVHISFNVKRPSWSFTKLFQRMKISLMRESLKKFAEINQIPLEEKGL
jgi:hypothetical protein